MESSDVQASRNHGALYPPSWVDRLIEWVARLPGPALIYYVGAALALILLVAASQWMSGVPFPTMRPFYLFFGAIGPYVIALIYILDERAAAALERFSPLLAGDEQTLREMRFRLTTLPAGPTLVATALGALVGAGFAFLVPVGERVRLTQLAVSPASEIVNSGLLVITWAFYGALFYHTLHQLREISQILDLHTQVNLFEVSPIHGFSAVTALTAVGITMVSVGWALTLPGTVSSIVGLLPHVLFGMVAAMVFVSPLVGVHNLLQHEKDEQLRQNAHTIDAVRAELRGRVEQGEFAGIDLVSSALAGLETERRLVEETPTWPWSPQTPRAVAAGLLLPLLIWGAQRLLESLLR